MRFNILCWNCYFTSCNFSSEFLCPELLYLGTVIQISFKVKSLFPGPSNRSNSVSSLDLEGESVSELGAGPSGSNGVEALQLLEHEQGRCPFPLTTASAAGDTKDKVFVHRGCKIDEFEEKK